MSPGPQKRRSRRRAPRFIIIAGPNGAGRTTFAQEFLPKYAGVVHFVNADLTGSGLSPFQPRIAAIRSGRLLLSEIDRLAAAGADFAVESTLGGLSLLRRFKRWKERGYRVEVIYLALASPEVALRRIAL